MKRRPGVEVKPDSVEDYIFRNALGNPLALDTAPTTAGAELPSHGDSGWFGTNFYINLGGTTYSIAIVAT